MGQGLEKNPDGSYSYAGKTFRAPNDEVAESVCRKLALETAVDAKRRARMVSVTPEQATRVKDLLRFEEGVLRKPTPVQGNLTLGIGRDLVTKPLTPTEKKFLKLDAGRDFEREPLTNNEADWLFESDFNDAVGQARQIIGADIYDNLDDARRATITSLAFQLGPAGLQGFPNMLTNFKAGNYDAAANELLYQNPNVPNPMPSALATQTPSRAKRAAEMIRTGQFSPGVPMSGGS